MKKAQNIVEIVVLLGLTTVVSIAVLLAYSNLTKEGSPLMNMSKVTVRSK